MMPAYNAEQGIVYDHPLDAFSRGAAMKPVRSSTFALLPILVAPVLIAGGLLLAACDAANTVNHAPWFISTPDTVAIAGEAYAYAIDVVDTDGDDYTIRMLEAPAWLAFEAQADGGAVLSGTPERKDAGAYQVRLQASDAEESAEQAFTLHVGYDFAGRYETDSYVSAYFFSNCQRVHSGAGGYYRMDLTPFGEVTVSGRFSNANSPYKYDASYTVSDDTLTVITSIDGNEPREDRAYWSMDLPRLKHLYSDNLPNQCQPDIELLRQ